jgi:hypothetical protein
MAVGLEWTRLRVVRAINRSRGFPLAGADTTPASAPDPTSVGEPAENPAPGAA